jgi:hypothetical protein
MSVPRVSLESRAAQGGWHSLHQSRAEDRKATAPGRRRLYALIIAANFGFWLISALHELIVRGLFIVLGGDWARFWGAARAFNETGPRSGYRLAAISAYMQPLDQYTHPSAGGIRPGPSPYPPIFMKLFDVFTLPDPRVGFVLWTALNLALAIYVARTLAGHFPTDSPWLVTLMLTGYFPLMLGLFAGQVVVLLLVCLLQAVTEFERGREFRAGIWCGLLVLKPQYAFCLVLVFLLKRRTAATTGFAVGACAIFAASIAVGGIAGMVAYARMLLTSYPSFTGDTGIDPNGMISWRGVVASLFPGLGTVPSLILVATLSLLTLALLYPIWRGEWDPFSTRFSGQLTATVAATLLVAYHSQNHGAALLLVPGSLIVARASAPRIVRALLVGAMVSAPLLGAASAFTVGSIWLEGIVTSAVMLAVLIAMAFDELSGRTPDVEQPDSQGQVAVVAGA